MKKVLLAISFLLLLYATSTGIAKPNVGSIVSPNANPCCRYWDVKMTYQVDEHGVAHLVGMECITGGTKTCLDDCVCNDINPIPA